MISLNAQQTYQANRSRASRGTPSRLPPFFGFHGGEWRDAPKYYPAPEYDTIVEPFAGSTGYSVQHAEHNVILGEKATVIFIVWGYLVHVSPHDILTIPDLSLGQTVADLLVCHSARPNDMLLPTGEPIPPMH